MSNIYKERNWKDDLTLEEELKYKFICAAYLLGIMSECYVCDHLRAAIRKLDEREVKENENKMD